LNHLISFRLKEFIETKSGTDPEGYGWDGLTGSSRRWFLKVLLVQVFGLFLGLLPADRKLGATTGLKVLGTARDLEIFVADFLSGKKNPELSFLATGVDYRWRLVFVLEVSNLLLRI
jgi:hypothetical protein